MHQWYVSALIRGARASCLNVATLNLTWRGSQAPYSQAMTPPPGTNSVRELVGQSDPQRSMIARLCASAYVTIDSAAAQARRQGWAQQKMIDAKPCIPLECVAQVLPEGIDPFLGDAIHARHPSSLGRAAVVDLPHFRPDQ